LTRISNVDQVLLLLREQLERASRHRGAERSDKAVRTQNVTARPLERAKALAAFDGMEPNEVRRTVVRGLLVEAFGEGAANDPAFQAVVDDVFRIITEMPGGSALIDQAVDQLRIS
jgi:hypothetical protein